MSIIQRSCISMLDLNYEAGLFLHLHGISPSSQIISISCISTIIIFPEGFIKLYVLWDPLSEMWSSLNENDAPRVEESHVLHLCCLSITHHKNFQLASTSWACAQAEPETRLYTITCGRLKGMIPTFQYLSLYSE